MHIPHPTTVREGNTERDDARYPLEISLAVSRIVGLRKSVFWARWLYYSDVAWEDTVV